MVTFDDIHPEGDPLDNALNSQGITTEYLAKKLKKELEAKSQKVFKDSEDKILMGPELVDWNVRQKARIDAHKLLGQYPAEKKDITVDGNLTVEVVKFSKDESTDPE